MTVVENARVDHVPVNRNPQKSRKWILPGVIASLVFAPAYGLLIWMIFTGSGKVTFDYILLGLNGSHAVFTSLAYCMFFINGLDAGDKKPTSALGRPLPRVLFGFFIYTALIYFQIFWPIGTGNMWDARIPKLMIAVSFLSALTMQVHAILCVGKLQN
ncbi:hypothetical protein HDU67_008808 [Dinochytrium kinnereticum]|nr:hypothetical protein HDU67_008808 [Dinochytrium kinnereticum]